jgi:large subunit ribosomal protein L24
MKIKTGDTVRVMVGKDKGKEGKVMQTFPGQGLVVVEGVRSSTRHLSAKKGGRTADGKKAEGQKVTFNAPIRVDNVAIVSGKATGRVGYQVASGKKTRILRVKKTVKEIG